MFITGHGAGDPGTSGCGYREADLTRELVNLTTLKLRRYVIVDVYNENRSALHDIQNGILKVGKYDYALEAHFNAFNGSGYGIEILVIDSEQRINMEQAIMNKLRKYFMRHGGSGIETINWLVIYTCKCLGTSSALLETCFIDNKADMVEYQVHKESVAQDIVDGIAEGFQLKAGSAERRPGNKPTAQSKPPRPSRPAQPDQILHKGKYSVIPGVHSVDQVLVSMGNIWCGEMTGNGGNSIQAGPFTKCDKNSKKTKSQVFSAGDYWKCDKKFKVLVVDKPTSSVQTNARDRKIWLYIGPLCEV